MNAKTIYLENVIRKAFDSATVTNSIQRRCVHFFTAMDQNQVFGQYGNGGAGIDEHLALLESAGVITLQPRGSNTVIKRGPNY
jgi:hypothetical protein